MENALTDMQNSGVTDIDFAAINSTVSVPTILYAHNKLKQCIRTNDHSRKLPDSCIFLKISDFSFLYFIYYYIKSSLHIYD